MITLKQLSKRFFQYEARLILKKYKPKIIAITGSVGKTTTKDFLYPILSKKFFVRKSEKSFTTELGVPLTIIGRPTAEIALNLDLSFSTTSVFSVLDTIFNFFLVSIYGLKLLFFKSHYPDFLILEVDGDKPGDLVKLSKWLHPDILVITEIGDVPSHIEAFDSDLEKFLNEKKSLINSVSRDGVIIYNSDDESVAHLVNDSSARKIACGTTPECNIQMSDFTILYGQTNGVKIPTGMNFEIIYEEKSYPISFFSSLGKFIQYASILATAVAFEMDIPIRESIAGLAKSNLSPGRMRILAGIKDTIIIDDTYNSSPIALKQALETFNHIETLGRKVVVMGDMLELGKFSAEEHRRLGQILKDIASYVVCVGFRSRRISEELLSLGFSEESVICFDTSFEAGKFLQNIIQTNDLILVKGSQLMRMERVVEEIMRHPEDKSKLLVRQEPEWLTRN